MTGTTIELNKFSIIAHVIEKFVKCIVLALHEYANRHCTRMCTGSSALSEVEKWVGLENFLKLLLAGMLLGLQLPNRSKLRRISVVSALPVPPPCSSELSFNTFK